MKTNLPPAVIEEIQKARVVLTTDSPFMRVTRIAGVPVESAFAHLPEQVQEWVNKQLHAWLNAAVQWANHSLGSGKAPKIGANALHSASVILTGFVGGLGGLVTTWAELPVSSMMMLRSIAAVARRNGFNADDPKVRLLCISIFGMGEKFEDANHYWATRKTLGVLVTEAAQHGAASGCPRLAAFLMEVCERFGVKVTQKLATQFAPVVGGLAGAGINSLFMNHYQRVAQAHFTLDRLVLEFGETKIRHCFEAIDAKKSGSQKEGGVPRGRKWG